MQRTGTADTRRHRSLKGLGAVGFAVFLLKGLAWLALPVFATCAGG
jgi:hypothetical protein